MGLQLLATSSLLRPRALLRASSPLSIQSLPTEVLRLCHLHHQRASLLRHHSTTSSPSAAAAIPAAQLQFGQAVHETHPHLLAPGEITPRITAQEYHDRRAALAALLPPNAVAILPSADIKWRSGAVFHPFRQESNLLYLTGFLEPESLAVIHKSPRSSSNDFTFHLYCRPKDPALEQWSGPWSGVEAAEDVFNADVAAPFSEVETRLAPLLQSASKIYTDADLVTRFPHTRLTPKNTVTPTPLAPLVNSLRVHKSAAELSLMRHAGRVSGRALTDAMRRAWTREHDLARHLDHEFSKDGLSGPGYVPVVAGGARANMIHYTLNSQALHEGEMVLVDAGGEFGAYITDISRTWPVSGRFSGPQRDLYEAVLGVQRASVKLCRADSGLGLDDVHRATEAGLKTALRGLGFDVDAPGLVGELFPHHVGHYIGLDVHDCPGYSRGVKLRKGMCVTVEPGVYVPEGGERFPKHFRGMGVRIEDSVFVDDEGPIVLSVEAVKEVVDIEALRS